MGLQGPAGPTGATGPAGPAGPAGSGKWTVLDATNQVLGLVTGFDVEFVGVVTGGGLITSTGYMVRWTIKDGLALGKSGIAAFTTTDCTGSAHFIKLASTLFEPKGLFGLWLSPGVLTMVTGLPGWQPGWQCPNTVMINQKSTSTFNGSANSQCTDITQQWGGQNGQDVAVCSSPPYTVVTAADAGLPAVITPPLHFQ
jgi:hypothetical protein